MGPRPCRERERRFRHTQGCRAGRPGVRLNVAFTYTGLKALGLDQDALDRFPPAFVEGLGAAWVNDNTPDHRSRVLGDVGESRSSQWEWGSQGNRTSVDAVLLV